MSFRPTKNGMRRRTFIGAGAGALGAGLAGCLGGGSGDGGANNSSSGGGANSSSSGGDGEGGGSHSVTMAPVGTVTFDGVPKTWVANNGSWADMGVALGVEPPKALWLTARYYTRYYEGIPNVSVDKSGMQSLYSDGVSKEQFYQLDADVHVMDPNFLRNRYKGWEQSDVDDISRRIAPFFGNSIFSRGYPWHEGYRYYDLYGAFEKLSKVFEREQRYEAFSKLHDGMQKRLTDVVPSKRSERPNVAILWATGDRPESFLPYVIDQGTSFKQWRDLKVTDALAKSDVANFHSSRTKVDYETLLEVDPEVLLLRGHETKTADQFRNTVVSFMESHSVASKLTAVKNGEVYRGGPLYQGPITNLVLTERAAKQLYADRLSGPLFDPQRVSDVVNGKR